MSDLNSIDFDTDEEDFDTVMAHDISFTGSIKFSKPFMIKGRMNGTIEASSDLLIDTDAEVNADISTDRVLVRGKVVGNISGRRLVHVSSTGSVTGDITTAQVVLEPGCSFSGRCSMTNF
jgi:cytoskeletal protein CcmA (bactofilin family)